MGFHQDYTPQKLSFGSEPFEKDDEKTVYLRTNIYFRIFRTVSYRLVHYKDNNSRRLNKLLKRRCKTYDFMTAT